MPSAVPAVMPAAVPPARPAPLSALDAPLIHPVHTDEALSAFGFGPPPAVVSPIGQSAAAPSHAGAGTGAERPRAEREADDEPPRLRAPRGPRPTFPPEPPPSAGAGRIVLVILGTVVAAAAAGGVAWYVWLR